MRITRHGRQRLRERAGVKKSNAYKAVIAALRFGLQLHELNGELKKYAVYICESHGIADNVRIYHQKVLLFRGEALITVLHLPSKFHRAEAKLKLRHRHDPES